jgi:2-C-methyl-D-erythritol 4-phosphate cytidylyltransferase
MPSPTFCVVILTTPPPGQLNEAGGAFMKVDGRECLLRSVELFLNRDNVKQILLVVDPERMEDVKARYGAHLSFSGVKLVKGGPRWLDQIAAAGPVVSPDATHVIVHDAARPAVPFSDIDAVMEASEKHDVVGLTTPVRATLVETAEGGNPLAYHLPNRYLQLLTPQCISKGKFAELTTKKQELHASTAHLVAGSALNVRVGTAADVSLAKTYINMLPKPMKAPLSSPFEEAQW